jgi:hypothetical protein
MPHGKTVLPFGSMSMPMLFSSTVPFVIRLSPLHPGYVITVCALAIFAIAEKATRTVANIMAEKMMIPIGGQRRTRRVMGE